MSEELNNAIKQISNVLSQDKGGDALTGLLSLLTSSAGTSEKQPPNEGNKENPEANTRSSSAQDNVEMIRQVSSILNKMNTKNDPRVNLLYALQPFLKDRRRKKLKNCILILQIASLTQMMDEQRNE